MTRSVLRFRASNWGGTVPSRPTWADVMSLVLAPLQLTSVSAVPGIASASSAG